MLHSVARLDEDNLRIISGLFVTELARMWGVAMGRAGVYVCVHASAFPLAFIQTTDSLF